MLFLVITLQWLHVLGGIVWFGSSVTNHVVVVPAIKAQPAETQAAWWHAFSMRYGRIIAIVAGLTVVLGIGRGLAGGVLSILGSAYGVTWIASLLIGVGLAFVGARLTGPTAARLGSASQETSGMLQARVTTLGRVELGLFLLLFSLMIAMRFGY